MASMGDPCPAWAICLELRRIEALIEETATLAARQDAGPSSLRRWLPEIIGDLHRPLIETSEMLRDQLTQVEPSSLEGAAAQLAAAARDWFSADEDMLLRARAMTERAVAYLTRVSSHRVIQ